MITKELISKTVQKTAWRDLSAYFCWTDELLEKYQDQLDWELVSQNIHILWTPEMLEKYKNRIDWTNMASSDRKTIINVENLRRFKNYWDWEKLSEEAPLTDEIIDEFTDKLDWELVSQNEFISWTPEMLDKYKNRLDWTEFTSSRATIIDVENLRRFKDYWDWEELSSNSDAILTYEIIDEFIDKWDWKELIDQDERKAIYTPEFLDRYFKHISKLSPYIFKESRLAECLIDLEANKMAKEIVFSCSSH